MRECQEPPLCNVPYPMLTLLLRHKQGPCKEGDSLQIFRETWLTP